MVTVNGWDDTAKLQWLHVHVTGNKTQKTQKMPFAHVTLTQKTYEKAKRVICKQFDSPSKRELYKVEMQCRVKRETESWGDFGNRLRIFVDKGYPEFLR